ncbi:MAG: hypothetical protein M1816_000204 [Peltula sp. TS41687]|nr:MAG: hypothetical protein M1816_000204 [Peltula sp. TS41687]
MDSSHDDPPRPSGFTPVGRPEPIPSTPAASRPKREQIWNAARCKHHVRKFTSRVELLRGHPAIRKMKQDAAAKASKWRNTMKEGPEGGEDDGNEPASDSLSPGSCWLEPKKRKSQKKYSARGPRNANQTAVEQRQGGTTNQRPFAAPGQVILDTPILRRLCERAAEIDSSGVALGPHGPQLDPNRARPIWKRRGWPSLTDSSIDQPIMHVYGGIHDALKELLQLTPNRAASQPVGARSLFSTCLRQIPKFVEEDEAWFKEYLKDSGNTSALDSQGGTRLKVYDELEVDMALSQGGWKPLGQAIRAHGVSIIADAIREGLYLWECIDPLLDLCKSHEAFDEAEVLLEALVDTYPAAKRPSMLGADLNHSSMAFSAVADFVQYSGRRGFQYRLLTGLLREGRLAPELFSKRSFNRVWNDVIRAVLSEKDKDHVDAFLFLETALGTTLIQEDERHDIPREDDFRDILENNVTSLLGALLAISLLGDKDYASANQAQTREEATNISRLFASLWGRLHQEFDRRGDSLFRKEHHLRNAIKVLFMGLILFQGPSVSLLPGGKRSSYEACSLLTDLVRLKSSSEETENFDAREARIDLLACTSSAVIEYCHRAAGDTTIYRKAILARLACLKDALSASDHLSERQQVTLRKVIAGTVSRLVRDANNIEYYAPLMLVGTKYARYELARSEDDQEDDLDEALKDALFDSASLNDGPSGDRNDDLSRITANTPAMKSKRRRRGSDVTFSDDDSPAYSAPFAKRSYLTRSAKRSGVNKRAADNVRLFDLLKEQSPGRSGSDEEDSGEQDSEEEDSEEDDDSFSSAESTGSVACFRNRRNEKKRGFEITMSHGIDIEAIWSPERNSFTRMQNRKPAKDLRNKKQKLIHRKPGRPISDENKKANQSGVKHVSDMEKSDDERAESSRTNAPLRLTDLATRTTTNNSNTTVLEFGTEIQEIRAPLRTTTTNNNNTVLEFGTGNLERHAPPGPQGIPQRLPTTTARPAPKYRPRMSFRSGFAPRSQPPRRKR